MARLSRVEREAKNRQALVESAEALFAERGIDGASLDDIAERAELTKGGLYTRYSSKGDLALAVIEHRLYADAQARRSAALLADPDLSPQERFDEWIAQWSAIFRSGSRQGFARLLFEFVPYALRDPDLMGRFAAVVGRNQDQDGAAAAGAEGAASVASVIPPGSAFAALPAADQQSILTALDLGLALQSLVLPGQVNPEVYGTALRLLTAKKDSG